MSRSACSPIYKTSGTYWWWCQTSTLFTVIYKVMNNGALSSSIHAGTVSATGLPAIRIRTPALQYLTNDLQCLWSMTQGCDIGISCQGWQRGHKWHVRRGTRRLLRGRRRPSRRGILGHRRCIGAERLDKRVKPGLQCRQDWGEVVIKAFQKRKCHQETAESCRLKIIVPWWPQLSVLMSALLTNCWQLLHI